MYQCMRDSQKNFPRVCPVYKGMQDTERKEEANYGTVWKKGCDPDSGRCPGGNDCNRMQRFDRYRCGCCNSGR